MTDIHYDLYQRDQTSVPRKASWVSEKELQRIQFLKVHMRELPLPPPFSR